MFVADVLAVILYWPLARFVKICESPGVPVKNCRLSTYRNRSFVFMRNDSLDRFGTVLEHRFTRAEIREMMQFAGLTNVQLSGEARIFWCAVGYTKVL